VRPSPTGFPPLFTVLLFFFFFFCFFTPLIFEVGRRIHSHMRLQVLQEADVQIGRLVENGLGFSVSSFSVSHPSLQKVLSKCKIFETSCSDWGFSSFSWIGFRRPRMSDPESDPPTSRCCSFGPSHFADMASTFPVCAPPMQVSKKPAACPFFYGPPRRLSFPHSVSPSRWRVASGRRPLFSFSPFCIWASDAFPQSLTASVSPPGFLISWLRLLFFPIQSFLTFFSSGSLIVFLLVFFFDCRISPPGGRPPSLALVHGFLLYWIFSLVPF